MQRSEVEWSGVEWSEVIRSDVMRSEVKWNNELNYYDHIIILDNDENEFLYDSLSLFVTDRRSIGLYVYLSNFYTSILLYSVLFYLVLSCAALSCAALSCPVLCCLVLTCLNNLFNVTSHFITLHCRRRKRKRGKAGHVNRGSRKQLGAIKGGEGTARHQIK